MSDFDSNSGGSDNTGVSSGGGSTPSTQTSNTQTASSSTANNNPGSTAYELTDDTPVRVPGSTEPIRYGDLHKRLQADYTKKTQEAANLRKQLEQEKNGWMTQKQQEEANLKRLATELLTRARQGQTNSGDDFISQLSSMQYIDGKTAAALMREIQENGIGQLAGAIQQRDQVIEGLYRQLQTLGQTVQRLQGTYTTQTFDNKIASTIKQLGLPPEATDLAKEIYLAYEGDDLDQEFPQILQNRWNQIVNLLRAQDKARVEAARRQPFQLPGRGGNGTAGQPLGLKGHESSRETADFLWDRLHPSNDV